MACILYMYMNTHIFYIYYKYVAERPPLSNVLNEGRGRLFQRTNKIDQFDLYIMSDNSFNVYMWFFLDIPSHWYLHLWTWFKFVYGQVRDRTNLIFTKSEYLNFNLTTSLRSFIRCFRAKLGLIKANSFCWGILTYIQSWRSKSLDKHNPVIFDFLPPNFATFLWH